MQKHAFTNDLILQLLEILGNKGSFELATVIGSLTSWMFVTKWIKSSQLANTVKTADGDALVLPSRHAILPVLHGIQTAFALGEFFQDSGRSRCFELIPLLVASVRWENFGEASPAARL